jgi:glycosyltransferase involved in cell wall biosynthesis
MKKQVLYLYNNPDKLQELGENGLDYVSKYFNRDIIAEEYYQELKKLQ